MSLIMPHSWKIFQTVFAGVVLFGAVIWCVPSNSPAASYGPAVNGMQTGDDEIAAKPQRDDVEQFMAKKLKSAQRTLEGVMTNRFQLVQDECSTMVDLSRHAAWKQMASPVYLQDTSDFVAAAEFLGRMAAAEDSEGTAVAYARLTNSCANCHLHVRTPRVAQRESSPPSPIDRRERQIVAQR